MPHDDCPDPRPGHLRHPLAGVDADRARLCRLLGQPTPSEVDTSGSVYTFEKGVAKSGGGQGFADVSWRGHFGWEYKGKGAYLVAAYQQLNQYREALENSLLLVVCDTDRVEVHTNFTGTVARTYAFDLTDLLANAPTPTTHGLTPLTVLRALFSHSDSLKPSRTTEQATALAAIEFAKLADSLWLRGTDPEIAAHFLMRMLFCLFAEDIGLLPARLVPPNRPSHRHSLKLGASPQSGAAHR